MSMLRNGVAALKSKAPSDVVILSALRTPICRSYKGGLRDAYPEELLATVLRAIIQRSPKLDPRSINDVAVGTVLSELGGSKAARAALNSIEEINTSSTSLYTVNRACASSLQSIASVAHQISAGMISTGIAAGMESMTRNYESRAIPKDPWPFLTSPESPKDARDCLMPMGITAENVARRYGVSRSDQDAVAVASHQRAASAREKGFFHDEIVPFSSQTPSSLTKSGEQKETPVTEDDGIRPNTTVDSLAKLKPAFMADGGSTAGNSSQVSDGAAALLLMRRSVAESSGLADMIMGKFVGATIAGCKPDEMGVGPVPAIRSLLERYGLRQEDVHRWEINEAFGSQFVFCLRELGLEEAWRDRRVNPDGGAIALGHPLGATGARLATTLLHGLRRDAGEIGVVSMCVGTGMGMAGVFVRET